jgi:hypothetical protein
MTTQVLVFKTGMMGEYSTVAAFSVDEVSRAIAFWEDNPSDYITCDVWEGDKEVDTARWGALFAQLKDFFRAPCSP